ncbi:MAG: tRNA (5-methylaminomethyl-2-thiouridine)(34)-methyltransferase MnmD, partial [Crocinitomicaceae bacterium]
LFIPELNENYHSHHGAIQEARHVFINHGLNPLLKKNYPINILEVGWGTGLNCLLSCLFSENNSIRYTGIEAFPIEQSLHETLNYVMHLENSSEIYERLIKASWDKETKITNDFTLKKIHIRIQEWETEDKFDLVYYDAFGPRAQEEMWRRETLEKLIFMLKKNGIFVTYCAKGQLKRDIKELGCFVETLPGPPGKREMTRAVKKN